MTLRGALTVFVRRRGRQIGISILLVPKNVSDVDMREMGLAYESDLDSGGRSL